MTEPKEQPAHEDSDIDAALAEPNPKPQKAGDGGNLELWDPDSNKPQE